MIFRLSQRLARKLKIDGLRSLPLNENPFADWSAHLFTIARTQYIIVVNTKSLYSVLLYGKPITVVVPSIFHKAGRDRRIRRLPFAVSGAAVRLRPHEARLHRRYCALRRCRSGCRSSLIVMSGLATPFSLTSVQAITEGTCGKAAGWL